MCNEDTNELERKIKAYFNESPELNGMKALIAINKTKEMAKGNILAYLVMLKRIMNFYQIE